MGEYVDEESDGRLRMRLVLPREIPRDAPPPPGMPPLTVMLLDAFTADTRNGETLDTARDCGEQAPRGLALVGEAYLVAAARELVLSRLVDVAETRRDEAGEWRTVDVSSPSTDDDSLLRYWYRPNADGHALLRANEEALDRFYDQKTGGTASSETQLPLAAEKRQSPRMTRSPTPAARLPESRAVLTWFYVHPATGIVPADAPAEFQQLAPASWHPDGDMAQDKLGDEFLSALIEFFGRPGTTFEADLPLPDDQARLRAAAAEAGLTVEERGAAFAGALSPSLAAAFPSMSQMVLVLKRGGTERLHLHDDVREVFVHLDRAESDDLRALLADRGLFIQRRR